MMYWIVFALFTCAETFTDVLLSFWFPFYYEMKIIVVLWLLSPATRGSSILYRKFVHPTLKKKEQEIDEAINHAKAQGYRTILQLGARGVDYARYVIMQTAIKGGGGLMNQLRKSYSLSDLTDQHDGPKYRAIGLGSLQEEHDIVDHHGDPQYMRRSYMHPAHRSGSVPSPMEMYFSEVDLDLRKRSREERQAAIGLPLSLEDVSSGYSSADHLFSSSQGNSPTSDHTVEDILLRSSSIGSTHTKSRKPLYGGMSSNKSSEGIGSLVGTDELDFSLDASGSPSPPASLLSQSMLSELRNLLSSRKGDINRLLTSQTPSGNFAYAKISDSIVTKLTPLRQPLNENIKRKKLVPFERKPSPLSFLPTTPQSSGRSDIPSTANVATDDVQDSKEPSGRAGRYRKLRAPGPPSKHTSDSESMSDAEHGTVLRARMSLVSSKKMSGSVNILVESNAGKSAVEHGTKPTSIVLIRRKAGLGNLLAPSSLLRKRVAKYNHSLSMPNLNTTSQFFRPHASPNCS
ncbi:uncharacterized protein LOC117646951 isoform X1 [Thrips palmi]|nr:uncharacterized protein LOC117646951 isoform X1 [Thrips palmi]XP_034244237.1 uncharacterized protein LOC117646951 isoform X1 [Thrips palmi]